LHFATHGLLASESETILKAKAEPALVLTPPNDGASATELERDDGLLTASEVAQLQLDADWVVLSACNTAAGDKGDAEALAGLARAFFYAKARALLVSHWAVNSDATVELITKTVATLRTDPRIGRAEALRRSMASLISKGDAFAHPATWAPFVLVGEGQASARAPTAAAQPKTLPPAAKTPRQPDWQTEVLSARGTQPPALMSVTRTRVSACSRSQYSASCLESELGVHAHSHGSGQKLPHRWKVSVLAQTGPQLRSQYIERQPHHAHHHGRPD
jgi:CHAT domain